MQSNNGTSTKPAISREDYYPHPAQPPAHASFVPPPPPLPPPTSSIPPPPPMPAQFMTPGSSPWSTLQLPNSGRKNRTLVHDDSCKSSKRMFSGFSEGVQWFHFFIVLQRVDELQQELAVRINDRVGVINQNSTKEDVQRWLTSKQISPE